MSPRTRVIGAYDSGETGPLLIVTAAIHGNEPAGVEALERVFAGLARIRPRMCGRIVGLIGNLGALAGNVRFIDTDMNRIWTKAQIAALKDTDPALDQSERKEQRELIAAIAAELTRPHTSVLHLDLHSTSGDGPPFTIFGADNRSRRLVAALGIPAIFGIMKDLDGTMLDYSTANDFTCVVLEGGQNQAPKTIDHHESAVWLLLGAAAMLPDPAALDLEQHRARIEQSVSNLPPAVEVCFRYAIDPDEHFVMLPGFRSFQRVYPGQLLALGGRSGKREIRCPIGAILLMPKYQGQGNDGFFLARTVDLVA